MGMLFCRSCGNEHDSELGPECVYCGEDLEVCYFCVHYDEAFCTWKGEPVEPDHYCLDGFSPELPARTTSPDGRSIAIPTLVLPRGSTFEAFIETVLRYPLLNYEVERKETRPDGTTVLHGVKLYVEEV